VLGVLVGALAVFLPLLFAPGSVIKGAMSVAGYRANRAELIHGEKSHTSVAAVARAYGIAIPSCRLDTDRYLYQGELLLHRIGETAYVRFGPLSMSRGSVAIELQADDVQRLSSDAGELRCMKA
jgi:hypothetical protein